MGHSVCFIAGYLGVIQGDCAHEPLKWTQFISRNTKFSKPNTEISKSSVTDLLTNSKFTVATRVTTTTEP